MKIPIIGTGLSGLVGSRIVELLSDKYQFEDISLATGIDITDKPAVLMVVQKNQADLILHLAAMTDVDRCEKDKLSGENGDAWKINVNGTQNIVDAAESFNKKVLYISTDFVFDGNADFYTEDDQPNPINWYAQTKYEGEKIVLQQPKNLVIRIAYPYRAVNSIKKDFVHGMLSKLSNQRVVQALADHIFTPTLIDDIAGAIDLLIGKKTAGIIHVVGSSSLTPYQAAHEIAGLFGYTAAQIVKTTMDQYYQGRAPRPYKLCLKNDRISALGYRPKTFAQGLREIKRQGIQ